MLLGNLIKSTQKDYQKILFNGISFDSRKVKRNDIFFAIKGSKLSGTRFIEEAILKGAAAIVISEKLKNKNYSVPVIFVKDVRKSLSEACSNFYKKKPSNIIAVTGTNGKSSVVNFFYQILNFNKVPVASIGTLGIYSKNYNKKTKLTSLDSLSLHKNLEFFAKKKIKNVILEASSHGLEQKRLDYLNIKTGVFTNLSHDHLDYHKNMKLYFDSKMHLFKNLLKKKSTTITDEDNKQFRVIKKISKSKKIKILTIGLNSGSIRILKNTYTEDKQVIKICINSKIIFLKIPLIGYFQVKNLLMAILVAANCGLSIKKILKQIPKIKPVPGRLECIAYLENCSKIIIDFAHTPDALEQSLIALKNQFKNKVILVFGCGGDRDKKKRFIMGKIASKYCKKVFITDDNPRNENPKKIRKEIINGCKENAVEIGSRKKAIELAIKELDANEVLLVAGKGHETTQDYGNKIINFSDKKVIKHIINKNSFLVNKSLRDKKFKNIKYSGVSINTKTIKKNNLFFAIKGKNVDGHNFTKEAIKKGAAKLIISKNLKRIPNKKIIKVKNTFSSLNNLARDTRDRSLAKIIGITGSVGKTTLKNLLSFALEIYGAVYCSPHSYNNKYGVPLSLCNLKRNTQYGVLEIGMNKKGEINNLSKIVRPEIAVITNIATAHLKNFSTLKDVAKAKAEIINNIVPGGIIILNKDNKFFNFLSKKAKINKVKIISFGIKKKADIFLLGVKKTKNYYVLKINVKNKTFYFNSKYSTESFISNILACIGVMHALNLNLTKIKNKFITFKIPEGRGDIYNIKKFKRNFKFVDESYNANPFSMLSAIKNIHSNYKKKRKLIFLGDMLELGNKSLKFHRDLAKIINKTNIYKVFVYGAHIQETFNYLSAKKKGKVFKNLDEAHNHFGKILRNNDIIMVKGSNATGLSQFSKNFKKGNISVI